MVLQSTECVLCSLVDHRLPGHNGLLVTNCGVLIWGDQVMDPAGDSQGRLSTSHELLLRTEYGEYGELSTLRSTPCSVVICFPFGYFLGDHLSSLRFQLLICPGRIRQVQ